MTLYRMQIPWRDPVTAFAPLRDEPFALLLHGPNTRWSYICARPSETMVLNVAEPGAWERVASGLGRNNEFYRPKDAPPFCGGWAGLLSYEFGRSLLPHLGEEPRRDRWPDMAFGLYPEFIAFDHERGRAEHWSWRRARLKSDLADALGNASLDKQRGPLADGSPKPRLTGGQYEAAIAKAVAYVRAGDCIQVNLSQRFDFQLSEGAHPFDLFRKLTHASAAPFSAYFRIPGLTLVSNSPEQFLEVRPGDSGRFNVRTRPIKGTRPRGQTKDEDCQLAEDLSMSEKDRAENLMIVDLMRNDLARVSRPGSVKVAGLFEIESFANVHHLVSTVVSELNEREAPASLVPAAFPGGSVTGAPKIRAMQVISELEHEARGPYCGSLVWITADGWMDSSILIRSAALEEDVNGRWQGHFRTGGGIVSDSDPAKERQETLDKASAMIRALTEAEGASSEDIVFLGSQRLASTSVSARDRAFLLGDGCFETLRYADGKIEGVHEHLALLRQSAGVLGIDGFPDSEKLAATLSELVAGLNGDAAVRLTLSRGAGGRGADAVLTEPLTVLSASPLSENRPYPPMKVITSSIRRNETSPLSRIKSTSYGDNLAARREAARAGAEEALMINMSGRPACLAMGNIFLRKASGDWATPPAAEGVREGYMRSRLITDIGRQGAQIEIRPISLGELSESGASVFGVNSLWGMRPILSLDGKPLALFPPVA